MKKILITFFVILFNINVALATCSIEEGTAPILSEYLNNNNKILTEVGRQLREKFETNYTSNANIINKSREAVEKTTRIYSKAIIAQWFSSYFSEFKYIATFPITNEVPKEIRRDYQLLNNLNNKLTNYLNTLVKNDQIDIIIENICTKTWITENNWICNISNNSTAWDLIGALIKNNEIIMNFFRKVVMWEEVSNDLIDIQLISNNFPGLMKSNYNPESYLKCSEKTWFKERINESFKKISDISIETDKMFESWKEAIKLMKDDKTPKISSKKESDLLWQELSKKWIYWDNYTNLINAQQKYNQESSISKNFGFLTNTFNNTVKKITNRKKEIEWIITPTYDTTIKDIQDIKTTYQKYLEHLWKNNKNIDIKYITKWITNSENTIRIKELIDSQYATLANPASESEYNISSLLSRMAKIHIEISNSIDTLNETCEDALKVCKEQAVWLGNCGTCK